MNGFDSEYLNILNNVFNDLNFYHILKVPSGSYWQTKYAFCEHFSLVQVEMLAIKQFESLLLFQYGLILNPFSHFQGNLGKG